MGGRRLFHDGISVEWKKAVSSSSEDTSLLHKTVSIVSCLLPYGCVTKNQSALNKSGYKKTFFDINGYEKDETPVHEVCVDGFWIGKYEVTQGQWERIMEGNPSKFDNKGRFPVERVSWNRCKEFIEKLNSRSGEEFRLPTEAEWEYAARSGGKNERYAGGNDINRLAWYIRNSSGSTHKVGTKDPNGLGLYDMSGNVWEWCEDQYAADAYAGHSRTNPLVASGESSYVLRGGCWSSGPENLRVTNRHWNSPSNTYNYFLGFRLCLPKD